MGNDMFNDEQLAHAEIVQKETEDALGFWKDRALKAEAKLADKYLIEEQYEAACGDRDGLLRMVETLREQKNALLAERDAALSRARETDGAVREAAERFRVALAGTAGCDCPWPGCDHWRPVTEAAYATANAAVSALSSPPRSEATTSDFHTSCDWCKRDIPNACYAVLCSDCDRRGNTALFAPPADAATKAVCRWCHGTGDEIVERGDSYIVSKPCRCGCHCPASRTPAPAPSTDPWRACGCADPDNCEHVFPAPAPSAKETA